MRVGGVDHPASLWCTLEQRGQIGPVILPGAADLWVSPVPLFCKALQLQLGQIFGCRPVNALQISSDRLVVFPGDVFERVAHHMHDAQLDPGVSYSAARASGKPLSPSTQAIRMS